MESNKQHFRHFLLFYQKKGKNAVQARKKLTDVCGEDVLTVRQCQNWFAKFQSGNFDVQRCHLDQFFARKDQKFYERGIMLLSKRWQKLLGQNG